MTIIRRMAVLVGLAGLALAGCGDDGDTLSEEDYLEQGNEICSEGGDEIDAAAEELFGEGEEPSPEQLSDFADVLEDNISGQIDDLEQLEGPDELDDDVDEVLDDAREVLDDFAQRLRDDPESAFSEEEDPFADINTRLDELGLTECAE